MVENIYKTEEGKIKILERYKDILDSWPVQNKQYTIETEYGDTFVIESGSREKPALLLFHGSVSNSFTWFSDVEELSKNYNVYAIDIIGEPGFSQAVRPEYESGAYPLWINSILDTLGLKSATFVGLSLGGWMSLSFAVKYPEKVDKMILLCPGGLYKTRSSFIMKSMFFSLLGPWGSKQIFKMINGGSLPDSYESGMNKAFEFTSLINQHFNPRRENLYVFSDLELAELSMPILVLYGEKDYLLNANKSIERIKAYGKNVTTELLPDTGHVLVNQADRIIEF